MSACSTMGITSIRHRAEKGRGATLCPQTPPTTALHDTATPKATCSPHVCLIHLLIVTILQLPFLRLALRVRLIACEMTQTSLAVHKPRKVRTHARVKMHMHTEYAQGSVHVVRV
jgi:hypothetical protein